MTPRNDRNRVTSYACGLNMDGITVAKLCSTLGQVKLHLVNHRSS